MHEAVLSWVGQFRTLDDLSVLDIGGRDLNGSPRMFFPNASPYHVLDLRPGPNVDIVADAAEWRPALGSAGRPWYDLAICTEVFEHTQAWPEILATAYAALRPGGWLIFTCAGPGRPAHSGIEAVPGLIDGEHYANVSPQQIESELRGQGWMEIETHLRGTDTQGKAVKPVTPRDHLRVALDMPPVEPREVLMGAVLSRTSVAG